MKKNLDMRGYSCPIPLLRTRDALKDCDELDVLLDEPTALENILKFVNSQNFKSECIEGKGEWNLRIAKPVKP